ncbi:hypothetical protein Q9299_20735 [Gemmobacter fulvus]|uniref:hypothetical protein n=1 Tax=Gemmobacter fulvus TaxID=2840474 RepID=UPI002796875D|nr:hypothetical protein [Gemmobacter fulvus]MDQ1850735.1 hypothetical protein [Gemmobacter fulvus]
MTTRSHKAAELPPLPEEVIAWFRARFEEANRSVTENLVNNPNARETTLDDALLAPLQKRQAPVQFPSGTVVHMQVHNIGGLRRLYRWEVADIGVLVTVSQGGVVQGQKIGVLQAKRLYPRNNEVLDEDPEGFRYGLNEFLFPDPMSALSKMRTVFEFDEECRYGALTSDSDQSETIERFAQEFGPAVSYLFYNPADVPDTMHFPASSYRTLGDPPPLGARVVSAKDVHAVLAVLAKGQAPTLASVRAGANPHNRLEEWAEEFLRCRVGVPFDRSMDDMVERLIARRSGPIGAVIAFSIALPGEG